MNREIKFRAWDKNSPESGMSYRTLEQITEKGFGLPVWSSDGVIMQFTGLRDRSGEEIYEGDIVEIHRQPWCENNPFEIYWCAAGFYRLRSYDKVIDVPVFEFGSEEIALLGNIYESPELLKEVV
jgi:uncharacterized phage protein (TIGR01671 family)